MSRSDRTSAAERQRQNWIDEIIRRLQLDEGLEKVRDLFGKPAPLPAGVQSRMVVPGPNWRADKNSENFIMEDHYHIGLALQPTSIELKDWARQVVAAAAQAQDMFAVAAPSRAVIVRWSRDSEDFYYRAGARGRYDIFWWPQHNPHALEEFTTAMVRMRTNTHKFSLEVESAKDEVLAASRAAGSEVVVSVPLDKFIRDIAYFREREMRTLERHIETETAKLTRWLEKHPPSGATEFSILRGIRVIQVKPYPALRARLNDGTTTLASGGHAEGDANHESDEPSTTECDDPEL